jgi:hypothetical protein
VCSGCMIVTFFLVGELFYEQDSIAHTTNATVYTTTKNHYKTMHFLRCRFFVRYFVSVSLPFLFILVYYVSLYISFISCIAVFQYPCISIPVRLYIRVFSRSSLSISVFLDLYVPISLYPCASISLYLYIPIFLYLWNAISEFIKPLTALCSNS